MAKYVLVIISFLLVCCQIKSSGSEVVNTYPVMIGTRVEISNRILYGNRVNISGVDCIILVNFQNDNSNATPAISCNWK